MTTAGAIDSTHQAIVDSLSDALVFADTGGVIRIWNRSAELLWGFTAAEALGQRLDLIIPERLREAHWRGFEQAIARGAATPGRASATTRSLCKSGAQLYVDMSFSIVVDGTGAVLGSAAVARDVTTRYLQERARRAGA
jgi:PAS domain S-box-containing protein